MTDWTRDLTAELPLGAIPFGDRTLLTGGAISDNGDGSATVATCTAWCKISDSDTAVGAFFTFVGDTSISLTDMTTNYIYLDYNDGSPQIVVATSITTHGFKQDHIHVGTIFRNGTTLHFHLANNIGIGGIGKTDMHHREETAAHRASGLVTSNTGLSLSITAGVIYEGLSRQATTVNGSTWSTWYRTNGVWTEVTGQTTVDNAQYNDTSSGLANFTSNRYGTFFVYVDIDGTHLHLVYGTGNVVINLAEEAGVPATLPNQVVNYGVLIAKIIVQQGQTTLTITYPWTTVFTSNFATDHGSLGGLSDVADHAYALLHNGTRALSGAWDMGSQALTNVNIDSGTIDGVTITQPNLNEAVALTATATELNLLDLAALTAGDLLIATGAASASWQPAGAALDYGLSFEGVVTTLTDSTHFKVSTLAGKGTGFFKPTAGMPYEIYVVEADGAAPEGQQTPVVAYTTADGTFQHAAFTTNDLEVGDIVLIIHPLLATLGTKATAAASGAVTTTDYLMAYVKQLVTLLIAQDVVIDNIHDTDLPAVKADTAAIIADTEDLQGNVDAMHDTDLPAVKGVVDALDTLTKAAGDGDLAAMKTAIDAIPTTAMRGTDNVVLAGPTKSEMDTGHGLLATEAKQDVIDGIVDAIKLITDTLISTDWKGNFNWDTSAFTTDETDISNLFSTNLAIATRRKYSVKLDLTTVEADGSFVSLYLRVKEKIDGTNYRTIDLKTILKADISATTGEAGIPIVIPATSENIQITMQMTTALAGDATIYYAVVKEHLE